LRYRQSDGLLGSVAVEMFGGAIPAGDGAVRTSTVNCVTGTFHDGRHLAGGAIGARFGQRLLPGHTAGEHGNGEENRKPLHIAALVDAESEIRWTGKKIQASGREKRTENRGAKAQETRGEKHRRQQKYKEMAV